MKCNKCGSMNVTTQIITEVETRKRGCLNWVLWILLALTIIGLIFLIIPMFTNSKKKSKSHVEALCHNCGYHWIPDPREYQTATITPFNRSSNEGTIEELFRNGRL